MMPSPTAPSPSSRFPSKEAPPTQAPNHGHDHHPGKARSLPGRAWSLIKETATDWSDDNASRLAASLAYYTLLSLAPLVVLCIAVAGLAFGDEAARGQIAHEIAGVVGSEAGSAVQTVVAHAKAPAAGILSTIIGLLVLLFGASGVFGELQSALNTVWEVQAKPGRGIMGVIRDRFLSFTMVLGVAFLLLVSLVVSAALAGAEHFLADRVPVPGLLQGGNFLLNLAVTTLLFALIFKVIPDVKVAWRDVWVGALATSLLFSLGRFLLGWYIGRAGMTSSYGAAGSFIALVVWVYYSAQILFFGAEFTQVYARQRGAKLEPSKNAVALPKGSQPEAAESKS